MLTKAIFALSYLVLFALSAYFYKNNPKYYAASKTDKSDVTIKGYSLVNVYLRVSTLVIAVLSVFSDSQYLLLIHHNVLLAYTGLGLTWVGMYLFVRSRTDLGDNYSPCYDAYLPHSITRQGLYSFVRHPIYSSNIFMLAALFLATGSLWILFNVLILSYFYNKSAIVEESELGQKYADYAKYMSETNRYVPSLQRVFREVLGSR